MRATPARWAPAPLPPLPRFGADTPYAALVPSPLRTDTHRLAGWTARIALGDARYRREPSDLQGAAFEWLQAWRGADRVAVAAALEDRLLRERRRDTNATLLHFHLACYAPDPERAQQVLQYAYAKRSKLESAMGQMLSLSGATPVFFSAHLHLFASFSALSRDAVRSQQRLINLALCHDWRAVEPLAGRLVDSFPHLLAPRCLQFVAQVMLRLGEDALADDVDEADRAHRVMDFVRHLDGHGHFWAMGALSKPEHNWSWSTFLEGWYAVDPLSFGASYDDEKGAVIEIAPEDRTIEGLPFEIAIQLPLGETWAEAVSTWNEHAAQVAAREVDLALRVGP